MGCGKASIAHHFHNNSDPRFVFHNYDYQSGATNDTRSRHFISSSRGRFCRVCHHVPCFVGNERELFSIYWKAEEDLISVISLKNCRMNH